MNIKRVAASGLVAMSLVAAIGMGAYAVPEAPGGSGGGAPGSSQGGGNQGGGGAPGGGSSAASVSYTGATEFSSDTEISGATYGSTTGGQNAILVSGGTVNLSGITVNKTGDESAENSDFYGTNAGILVYNDGKLTLNDATINTGGGHANAVFAYGSGVIEINDSTIKTSGNNSGGVMVTGGGSLTANRLTVETAGNSSAAIRSDRGGGTMAIMEGSYKTTGVGSPAIYSTASIVVNGAKLESTASEGVVIEGSNSVLLDNVTLTDTNNTLNGNSETYKNVFIYQSMSGDAEEGTGMFTAANTSFTTNQGDTFFVTNTTALISLSNNTYINNDSDGIFLRAQAGKWGTSGANGGQVSLHLSNDEVYGDMELDSISSLTLELEEGSYLRGKLTASTASVKLSETSVWVLEGDVAIDALEDADAEYQNIYSNGHTLTVNGTAVSVNTGTPPEHKASYADGTTATTTAGAASDESVSMPKEWAIIFAALAGAGFIAVVTTFIVMAVKLHRARKADKAGDAGAEDASATDEDENMVK